jgi:hypothetical protein
MKVFLSAIPEVDPKLLQDTQKFLSKIGGPIEYQNSGVLDLAPYIHTFKEFENIEKLDELDFSTAILLGQRIKFKLEISYEDVLVIFTKKKLGAPIEESKSWFSYFGDNIIVVRDDELEFFPKGKWLYIYSHQVVENLFQLLSGTMIKSVSTFTHFTPKGCINDFCAEPPQIEFKLRMAHICENCLTTAYSNGINQNYLRQIKDTIEAVRLKLDNFKEIFSVENLSPVVVNEKGEILIENIIIDLQDLPKTLYLLFLKNPEMAIENHQLKGYKKELESIYSKIKRGGESGPLYNFLGLDKEGNNSIGQVNTEAFKNHRHFISKELKSKLGEAKSEFYQIKNWQKKVENRPQFYNQIGIPKQLIRIEFNM